MRKNIFLFATYMIAFSANIMTAEMLVSSNISASTTWTADNVYRLQNQVYVLPRATLTIEAETVVASTAGVCGSLAVCRSAKIYVILPARIPRLRAHAHPVNSWPNFAKVTQSFTAIPQAHR